MSDDVQRTLRQRYSRYRLTCCSDVFAGQPRARGATNSQYLDYLSCSVWNLCRSLCDLDTYALSYFSLKTEIVVFPNTPTGNCC